MIRTASCGGITEYFPRLKSERFLVGSHLTEPTMTVTVPKSLAAWNNFVLYEEWHWKFMLACISIS